MQTIKVYVFEEDIKIWEDTERSERPEEIVGVPIEIVNGPGEYQCVNGRWAKRLL